MQRTVKTVVTAAIGDYVSKMGAAASATVGFATKSAQAMKAADRTVKGQAASIAAVSAKASAEWGKVSSALVVGGAAGLAASALAVKAAVSWESAWAGVTKTVDGSVSEMATLEGSLRSMARSLPASHQEIASVAEAAGQLGVQRSSVAAFTRTMIRLGTATNLSAEEAATSIAQMANIMSTAPSDISRLGAALVELGNNSATTERDILEMAQRIAGAGRQVALSEADVLAFGAAIASTGVETEAGGTAISRTLLRIDQHVSQSGVGLQQLAKITGQTTGEFKRSWEKDAAGAMVAVVDGLGKVTASGGSADAELAKLGITATREKDVLLRLSSATRSAGADNDLLARSISMSSDAWSANSALIAEAEKRYQSTSSRLQIAVNQIRDAGISFGVTLLPAVAAVTHGVAGLAEAFGSLPGPVKTAAMVMVGLGSALALVTGGGMKAIAYVKSLKDAMQTLKTTAVAAGVSLKGVGLAAGGIGAVLTVASIAFGMFLREQQKAADIAQEYTGALEASAGAIDENVRATAAKTLGDQGALEAAEKLGLSMDTVTDAALGNADAMDTVQAAIDKYQNDKEWDGSQRADVLTEEGKAAHKLADAMDTNRESFAEASAEAKRLQEAVEGTSGAQDAGAGSTTAATAAFTEQTEEMTGLLEVLQQYGDELLKLSGDEIALEAAIDDATESIRENGRTLDINTAKGRANQTALNSIASSGRQLIATLIEQGASTKEVTAAQQRASVSFIQAATAAGMTKAEAKALAAQYFAIPKSVKTTVTDSGSANASWGRVNRLKREIAALPKSKRAEINAILNKQGADAAERRLNQIAKNRTASLSIKISTGQMWSGSSTARGKAAGGIMDFYAAGGVRDVANRHVAEIAPASTTRVWAEPETRGEAYIPLANDWRRPRAESIVAEVARRFGGQATFAAGGVTTPITSVPVTTSTMAVPADSKVVNVNASFTQVNPDAAYYALNRHVRGLL